MKKELFDMNFNNLLKYSENFKPEYRYKQEPSCSGFCLACEQKLQCRAEQVPLMSHGCSSDEIKKLLNQEEFIGENKTRIMFLLENPGGDYGNGEEIEYEGIKKNPPIKHFYFSPNIENNKWPETLEEISHNRYGNYFAYLIKKYSLNNVYITNCIKCKYCDELYVKTRDQCVEKYLKEEIRIFSPEKVIFQGHKAETIFKTFFPDFQGKTCYIWHPATRRSLKKIVAHNNEILGPFLKKSCS